VIGFGENAVVVSTEAPDTMLADAVAPVVVVVVVVPVVVVPVPVVVELGVPVEFELVLLHAAAERRAAKAKATANTRPICIKSPLRESTASPHANTLPPQRAYLKRHARRVMLIAFTKTHISLRLS
jgi:hypothetical protein